VLIEKIHGPFPGQFSVFLVVTSGRIDVEAVIRLRVHVHREISAIPGQAGLVLGPARVNARIQFGQLNEQRSPDVSPDLAGSGCALEGNARFLATWLLSFLSLDLMEKLAVTSPRVLACMHGAAWQGSRR
jgi:hypothetical protein